MPRLPKKKVGIVACSGEEMAEGTVTRLAALQVLESLRPDRTVTICLPLFLAGGEGDRAFARFYPTVAIDGCEKRCAARGTEMYSGKPSSSIVVSDAVPTSSASLGSARRLNDAGKRAVDVIAGIIARQVDELLNSDQLGRNEQPPASPEPGEDAEPRYATCACGSGIPVQILRISGRDVTLIALPLIFAQYRETGRLPEGAMSDELMEMVKIYNLIPQDEEDAYRQAIMSEYAAFCRRQS